MPVYVEVEHPRSRHDLSERRAARLSGEHRAVGADRTAGARKPCSARASIKMRATLFPTRLNSELTRSNEQSDRRHRRLPDRLDVVRGDREPRDGPRRSALVRLGQPGRDQRAAHRQQAGGDSHADSATRSRAGCRYGWSCISARASGWTSTAIALASIAVFLGHLYPVFFRFQGGKGVATAAGVLLAINPALGVATLLTWLIIAFFFALFVAGGARRGRVRAVFPGVPVRARPHFAGGRAMSALLIWRHRGNISKLLNGQESRIGDKKRAAQAAE